MLETRIAAPEGVLAAPGSGPAQVESVALRKPARRAACRGLSEACVAIAVGLDSLGVEAERDVVDGHAAVHLGEVNRSLAAVDEGVERPDDVIAIDPEVEREIVPVPEGMHA